MKKIKIKNKSYIYILILIIIVFSQSGCSLLQLPLELAKAPFTLLGEIFKKLPKLPTPPPGVFF